MRLQAFAIGLLLWAVCLHSPSLQGQKTKEYNIAVAGVCDMCKARIESAVDVKGVRFAEYDLATHRLKLIIHEDKVSLEDLARLLNEAGHDNEVSLASEKQYGRIHHCCQYRDHEHNH